MKISIDSILGSARKINNQRQIEEDGLSNRKKEIKSDSVSISRKVDTRLDKIETEFRDIQSSLTKNQILKNGMDELLTDLAKGGRNRDKIMDQVTFEGDKVLKSAMGGNVTAPEVEKKSQEIVKSMDRDVTKLKKLQVEVDNIMASNLAGQDKVENIMTNIDSFLGKAGAGKLENLTSLNVDSVMKLIK